MNDLPVVCSFSGVYDNQSIISGAVVLDFKNIIGCSMYIDQHAEAVLSSEISTYAPSGLHYLDNGNYHYMSRMFASFINMPFDMVVFDHHPDDQEPAIEGMRSCGSWVADMKADNKYLQQYTLIRGVGDITTYIPSDRPLYISIDKDILSEDILKTNWDQGHMSLSQFGVIFDLLLQSRRIIGIDVCGEDEPDQPVSDNERFNEMIKNRTSKIKWLH